MVVTLSNASGALTQYCAGVLLAARIRDIPAYAFGWMPSNWLIWLIGLLATTLTLITVLFDLIEWCLVFPNFQREWWTSCRRMP